MNRSRRIIASFLLVLTVLSFTGGSSAYASSNYKVLNPEKNAFSTMNKVVLVNGKAPTGTKVIMEVHGTTDLSRKNFNLANLPKDKDYIKRLTESAEAGNMGFFQKELALALGVNKVVVKFDKTKLSEEIIIYVYDKTNLEQDRKLINLK